VLRGGLLSRSTVEGLSLESCVSDRVLDRARDDLGADGGVWGGLAWDGLASSVEKVREVAFFELAEALELNEEEFEDVVEGGRMSNATCHQSIGPCARGALIGLNLLAPVELARLLALEAPHHLTDRFGALGGALPDLHLAVALSASTNHNLLLLPQSFFEPCEKGLIVPRQPAVHTGLGAHRKPVDVAFVIALQLHELCFTFRDASLARGKGLRASSLLTVNDVLNHLESLRALHDRPLSS